MTIVDTTASTVAIRMIKSFNTLPPRSFEAQK
jgi:hypothetical protein